MRKEMKVMKLAALDDRGDGAAAAQVVRRDHEGAR
eukprot:gene26989-biopygen17561